MKIHTEAQRLKIMKDRINGLTVKSSYIILCFNPRKKQSHFASHNASAFDLLAFFTICEHEEELLEEKLAENQRLTIEEIRKFNREAKDALKKSLLMVGVRK